MHGFLVDGHVYTYAMMHGEQDLHYPAWRYVGMLAMVWFLRHIEALIASH